jgi:UDP-2,3-diacylglucosamine pyrophosphatase LpxH
MKTIVVSDLHIGSRYFFREKFIRFLNRLPDNTALVLNGDTIDHPRRRLCGEDQEVLQRLVERSYRFPVIWIHGNHDRRFRFENPGNITIKTHHTVDHRIYMAHGNRFDHVMPRHRWFICLFYYFHRCRLMLGSEPAHVACYAKKYAMLYEYLRKKVMHTAVSFAMDNGYNVVACGHIHYAEDVNVNGVRYINTGAWTEKKTCCLIIENNHMRLTASEAL